MAKIELSNNPTLDAADRLIEAAQDTNPRPYLGMSSIGDDCERKIWYQWRWAINVWHNAQSLKRFADGHQGEALQATRLRMIPEINLITEEGEKQIEFSDIGGHLRGHADGVIHGIFEAPTTWHVWEHKQVDEKKQNKLAKLKCEDEKSALEKWDSVYYAQAVLYMHYSGLPRHYLTCSTPGGRNSISVRTNADSIAATRLIAKAERIIRSEAPPPKLYEDPTAKLAFACGWCPAKGICHEREFSLRNCRTCVASSPSGSGEWYCVFHMREISTEEQRVGCEHHRYIPPLVPYEQTDFNEIENIVTYKKPDGELWIDGGEE